MNMDSIRSTKKGVYYANKKALRIDNSLVNFLASKCIELKRNNTRICFHESHQSDLMVMLVVVIDYYIYPIHRHDWKDESYTIIKGAARFDSMNSLGDIQDSIELEQGESILNNMREYHRLVPKSEILAFIETTTGPFNDNALEFLEK